MKDQRLLFRKSLLNDIPAIIFQGKDCCAAEILGSAVDIYKGKGVSPEFLYDFERLVNDFKDYQKEYNNELVLPKFENFRDVKVLNECIYNEVPVVVFQSTDICAIEVLKSAKIIYEKEGCDKAFLSGLESSIKGFEEYGRINNESIKLPGLSAPEKDFVREDMDYDFESAVKGADFSKLAKMREQGYKPSNELIKSLHNIFSESTTVVVQKLFGIEALDHSGIQSAQSELMVDMKHHLSNAVEQSL